MGTPSCFCLNEDRIFLVLTPKRGGVSAFMLRETEFAGTVWQGSQRTCVLQVVKQLTIVLRLTWRKLGVSVA